MSDTEDNPVADEEEDQEEPEEQEVDEEEEDDDEDDDEEDEDLDENGDEPELGEHDQQLYELNVEIKQLKDKLAIANGDIKKHKGLLSKSRVHIKVFLAELTTRATDLSNLHQLCKDNAAPDQWQANFMTVLARHNNNDLTLQKAMFDTSLLPEINKAWQDQLWHVGGTLHEIQTGNPENVNDSDSENENENSKDENKNNDGNNNNQKMQNTGFALGHLMDELKGRVYDLSILQNIYNANSMDNQDADSNESREKLIDLMNGINDRQSAINKAMETNDISVKTDVRTNNEEWKDLIKQGGNSKQAEEELLNELQARTTEFTRVLNVLQGNEFPDILSNLADECEQRHSINATGKRAYKQKQGGDNNDESNNKGISDPRVISNNDEWRELLLNLSNDPQSMTTGVNNINYEDRCELFCKELDERSNDIIELKGLQNKYKSINVEKIDIGLTLDELKDQSNNLLKNIKQRHNENESEIVTTLIETTKPDEIEQNELVISKFKENERDWRAAFAKLLSSIANTTVNSNNGTINTPKLSFDPSASPQALDKANLTPLESINEDNTFDENEIKEQHITLHDHNSNDDDFKYENDLDENNDDMFNNDHLWWLDRDNQRKRFIDSIQVDAGEHEKLVENATYLNRVLPERENRIVPLYIPIEQMDNHHILSVLYDGSMVCELFNDVEPDFVDSRCIHGPNNLTNPYPLNDEKVVDNVNLALASSKALGLRLPRYDAKSWCNPKRHVPILLSLLDGLAKEKLETLVNFEKHPEIARLVKDGEDPDKVKQFKSDEWIKRWLNYILDRPVLSAIGDYNRDLWDLLCKTEGSSFSDNAPASAFNDNPDECSVHLINYLKDDLNINTTINSSDLLNEYLKCQELLAAQLFDTKNTLSPLNNGEYEKYSVYWIDDNPDDDALLPWINSMLPPHLQVSNLYKDLATGVVLLKVLDKVKPGCVNWKKTRQNIRHKFDRIHNCNYAMKLCNLEFPFHIIGIGGTDIADSHKKFIETLLWQIMRYQSTKTLSDLSFGGKAVTDKDILKWCKNTHLQLVNLNLNKSKTISSLRDKTLTNCVFYLELLKVVIGIENSKNIINDKFIEYNLQPLTSKNEIGQMKERLNNARYTISMLRRYASEIFVLPEDLVNMESKAVLSLFAAIMTLDHTLREAEEENSPSKNDEESSEFYSAMG